MSKKHKMIHTNQTRRVGGRALLPALSNAYIRRIEALAWSKRFSRVLVFAICATCLSMPKAIKLPSDLSHCGRSTTRLAKISLLIRTSHRHFPAVVVIVSGLAYTAWSEWYNTQITDTWVYAPAIPTLFGLGLSPYAQWLIIPALLLS